jgi:hypothetical protein
MPDKKKPVADRDKQVPPEEGGPGWWHEPIAQLSIVQRTALRDVLWNLKAWWQTPAHASGEPARLDALLESIERAAAEMRNGAK